MWELGRSVFLAVSHAPSQGWSLSIDKFFRDPLPATYVAVWLNGLGATSLGVLTKLHYVEPGYCWDGDRSRVHHLTIHAPKSTRPLTLSGMRK